MNRWEMLKLQAYAVGVRLKYRNFEDTLHIDGWGDYYFEEGDTNEEVER